MTTFYLHSVLGHLPVEDVKTVLLNMKKKVMHKKSLFIASLAILNFYDYRGYFEELDEKTREDKIKDYFKGRLFKII